MKPGIKVYDRKGNDVTEERDWYLGTDGHLYYSDTDGLHIDTVHHYEIIMKVMEETIWRT